MAYTFDEHKLGNLQISVIDTGVTSPSGVSSGSTTVIPTPPNTLGSIVKGFDLRNGAYARYCEPSASCCRGYGC